MIKINAAYVDNNLRTKEQKMAGWSDDTDLKDRHIGTFFKGLKILWQMTGEHKKNISLVFCLIVILSSFGISINYIMKLIFDGLSKDASMNSLSILIIAYCGTKIIWAALDHFSKESRFIKTIAKLEHVWPKKVQAKLLALSLQYHERENTGEKIEKIHKGCERLVDVMGLVFWSILPELVFMLTNIAVVAAINWKLGLLFMSPVIPIIVIQRKMQLKYTPAWVECAKKEEFAGGLFCQSVFNRYTVQGFVQEEREKERFAATHNEMEKLNIETAIAMQKYYFLIAVIMVACLAATILLGCRFVKNHTATLGTITYIVMAGGYMNQNLRNIMNNYSRVVRFMISVFRMKEILDAEIDIKDVPDAIATVDFKRHLALNHVSFTHPGKETPVLDDVSIKINFGEFVGITGISGAGKTTLFHLLNRMYEADTGAITVDDFNIRQLKLYSYRRLFAPVEQEVDIFDGTILANISYAHPNITQQEAIEAIRIAHLDAVLEDKRRFPNGLLTEVGERGVKLSGGERQRVGIARAYNALKQGARILMFDEATSNLDSEAEKAIQEMIVKLREDLQISIIVITHHLSTIYKADNIYVLENGKVIEEGKHDELVALKGRYHHLVELQKFTSN